MILPTGISPISDILSLCTTNMILFCITRDWPMDSLPWIARMPTSQSHIIVQYLV